MRESCRKVWRQLRSQDWFVGSHISCSQHSGGLQLHVFDIESAVESVEGTELGRRCDFHTKQEPAEVMKDISV